MTDPYDTPEFRALVEHIRGRVPVLSHDNTFIFFANRKCGLQSVVYGALKDRALIRRNKPSATLADVTQKQLWNQKWREYNIHKIQSMFKFSIIRNPYAKAYSAFFSMRWGGYRRVGYRGPFVRRNENFNDFVKTRLKKQGHLIDIHFDLQHPNVLYEGKTFLDFLARLENIENDWPYIANKVNCQQVFPHLNKSGTGDRYREFYDDESREIVGEIYKEDLKLFGYEF